MNPQPEQYVTRVQFERIVARVEDIENTLSMFQSNANAFALARHDVGNTLAQLGIDFHEFRKIATSQTDRLIQVFAETNRRLENVENSIANDAEIREVRQEHTDVERAEINRRLAAIEARQQWRLSVRRVVYLVLAAALLIAGGVWVW